MSSRDLTLCAVAAAVLAVSAALCAAMFRARDRGAAALEPVARLEGPRDGITATDEARLPQVRRAEPHRLDGEPGLPKAASSGRTAAGLGEASADARRRRFAEWLAKASPAEIVARTRELSEEVSAQSVAELDARAARGRFEVVEPESGPRRYARVRVEIHRMLRPGPEGGPTRRVSLPRPEYPELYARYDELMLLRKRPLKLEPTCQSPLDAPELFAERQVDTQGSTAGVRR